VSNAISLFSCPAQAKQEVLLSRPFKSAAMDAASHGSLRLALVHLLGRRSDKYSFSLIFRVQRWFTHSEAISCPIFLFSEPGSSDDDLVLSGKMLGPFSHAFGAA
jgi:hypothetical protein